MAGQTLDDPLWDDHLVHEDEDGVCLVYIDRQLLHEVTSPQAFEGLSLADRQPFRLSANLAVPDHNVPTTDRGQGISDPISALQLSTLDDNCQHFDIPLIPLNDVRQGIVHVMGPEQGATLPGMTIVCGDSHTATHGAFGAMAFGIGTSEVELALASQCLRLTKMKNMAVRLNGQLPDGVTSKDMILSVIGKIGTAGGTGYAIEFQGEAIKALSIESRMTICNMAIEAGARVGLVAVDDKTIDYFKDKPFAPKGEMWDMAVADWQSLHSDADAQFDKVVEIDAASIAPQVTYGTSPEMVIDVTDVVPSMADFDDPVKQEQLKNSLKYMGLTSGMAVSDIPIDRVFIGSCTNSRIEDLRAAAAVINNRTKADSVKEVLVVPGSGLVKAQAEAEGLDKVFTKAGFQWREPGCSMCLAMNDDRLLPGEHCASTSNRNFEGRQGQGGRTHLVSPAMAAAAAIHGRFVDIREMTHGASA
ncbi:MAG: 3-isopropylmalate dehydratase large subunit [Gammaproteobacteria bacterium]